MNCKKSLKAAAVALSICMTAVSGAISPDMLKSNSKITANALNANDFDYYNNFESGAGDWEGRGGATAAVSSDNTYEGSKALYVSGRTDSWNGCQIALGSQFTAGSSYSFSAAVSPKGKKASEMMLSIQYSTGGEDQYGHIGSLTVQPDKWGVISCSEFTLPADGSNFVLYVETASGSSDFYIDEIAVGAVGAVKDNMTFGTQLGDMDGDDCITTFDTAMLRHYICNQKLSAPASADLNSDKMIDIADGVLIQEYLFAKIDKFPDPPVVEEPEDDFEYIKNMQFKKFPGDYTENCEQAGKVVKEYYTSCHGGKQTSANVYLPYGYDENQKYNIFYLMHGGGENQDTLFSNDVNLHKILDHMIMNGDIEPMIVVTPTFYSSNEGDFWQELLQNLIPHVEGKYSTYAESTSAEDIKASRYHRAFGGFSMGSVCTWHTLINAIDYIAYFMPLSGDSWVGNSNDEKAQNIVNAIKKAGYAPDEYFIFCATGSDDIAYPNIAPQVEAMKKHTDTFIYSSDLSEGNFYFLVAPGKTHWWGYVVHYVYDILPSFFHEHQ